MATSPFQIAPDQFESVKAAANPPAVDQTAKVEDRLTERFKKYEESTRLNRRARQFIGFQAEMFWGGIQLFTYDYMLGCARIWDQEDQDMYCPINLTRWAVEMIAAEYGNSVPKLVPHSEQGEDRKTEASIPDLEYLADCLYFDFWRSDPELEQDEAHQVQFRGGVLGRVSFDPKAGPKLKVPRFKEQPQQLPGKIACPDCGAYGEVPPEGQEGVSKGAASIPAGATAAPLSRGSGGTSPMQPQEPDADDQPGFAPTACPECGSPNAQVSPPTTVNTLAVEGYDEIPQGALKYQPFDLLQVTISDRVKRISQAPWVRIDEICFRSKIKEEYGWVQIEDYAPVSGHEKSGLRFLRLLQIAAGNSGELDQSRGYVLGQGLQLTDELTCVRSYVYMDVCEYAEWPGSPVPWQPPGSDQIIPAGVPPKQIFPKGLLCHLVNDKVVKMEDVDKNDELDAFKYSPGRSGFYSSGIDNIVSINKARNEANSIQITWAKNASFGVTLVDEDVKVIENRAGWVGTVADRRPEESIGNHIFHQSTPGPSAEMQAMKDSFTADAQLVEGVRNSNISGLPGPGMRTATGVQYQSATADSYAAQRLILRAAYRARMMNKATKQWKARALRPQWFTKYGETRGKYIDPLNLPGDVSFRVEEDSHQPTTNDDQRANAQAYIAVGGGSGKLPPAIEDNLARVFRQNTGTDDYSLWKTKIEKRLDAMKQIAEMFAQQPGIEQDPQALQLLMQPMMPRPLDKPVMFIRFFDELYLSDEYDNFPPIMQLALDQLVMVFKMDGAQKMATDQGLAAAAMPAPPQGSNDNSKGEQPNG